MLRPSLRRLFCLVLWTAFSASAALAQQSPSRTVRLQLKWKHQFQFAGYYAAIQQGYYRDLGIEVVLLEPDGHESAIETVVRREADFGVAGSDLVLYRHRGAPVVALAVILQHSPLALLCLESAGVDHLHDLAGKTVALESQAGDLLALLQAEGLHPNRDFDVTAHPFDVDGLLRGDVVALSAYTTDEVFLLEQSGRPFRVFSPRQNGIDFYGDALFTSEDFLDQNPELVKAFREASLRGWEYAFAQPEAIIELILSDYTRRHSPEHLAYEARTMRALTAVELVPLGFMNPGRWQHVHATYRSLGLVEGALDLQRFLYQPETPASVFPWLLTGVFTAIIVLVSSVALMFFRLNRQLRREICRRQALELELTQLAMRDTLTDLPNRRAFLAALQGELVQPAQSETCLIACDLDYFKTINDTYGHAAGDAALQHFAEVVRGLLRKSDTVGRLGGEEFGILTPDTTVAGAETLAKRILDALDKAPFDYDGHAITISASFGITRVDPSESVPEQVLQRADHATYLAKRSGRHAIRRQERDPEAT